MKQIQKIQFYLILLLASFPISSFSQEQIIDSIECKPLIDSITQMEFYYFVNSMPEYPGGERQMLDFFIKNFNYPSEIDACCKIYVEFIIDTTGAMTNLKIVRGLQEDFDNETIRVLKMMPNWEPGKCNGIPVNVKYVIPLRIELN